MTARKSTGRVRRPPKRKASGTDLAPGEVNAFVTSVTKNTLRMQIFLLLYLNEELYLTDISNKLNRSKATVSRHLNAMETEEVLQVREVADTKSGKRKYYRLSVPALDTVFPPAYSDRLIVEFLNPDRRVEVYAKMIETVKSFSILFSKGFEVLRPLVNSLERSLGNLEAADREFAKYLALLFPHRMIHFEPVLISKDRAAEAGALLKEYRSRLFELRQEGTGNKEENSILVLFSMLPLRDILESSPGRNEPTKKKVARGRK